MKVRNFSKDGTKYIIGVCEFDQSWGGAPRDTHVLVAYLNTGRCYPLMKSNRPSVGYIMEKFDLGETDAENFIKGLQFHFSEFRNY